MPPQKKRRHGPPPTEDAPPATRRRRYGAVLAALGALALALAFVLAGRDRRPSLLLVTIDTLRADHVGAYGDPKASTPVMDGLARRGIRFASAHSAVPMTGPSHATILTGVYPPVHGVRENVNFILDARHPTLATRLKRQGYATGAFIGAYPVASGFGFGQGFDTFDEAIHPNPGIGQGAERPANEVAAVAIAWLRSLKAGPFFAWVHFYDPHAPYTPPPPYLDSFRDRPYDGEVAFADSELGRVLSALETSGRLADTLVVVLSDHGEGLGEHGEGTHGLLLYESTLRIPFLVAGPGVPQGRVVRESVGTVDVLPTVLGLLGVQATPPLPGRDLRPAFEERRLAPDPLYSEALFGRLNCRWASLRGWTEGDWKLIEGAEPELFHLSSDPAETDNRAAAEPARVEKMRAALHGGVHAMAPDGDKPRPATLSPEQAERLQSLGYTAGTGGAGSLDEPDLPDPRPRIGLFERLEVLQSAIGPSIDPALKETLALVAEDQGNPFAYFVLASLAYRGGHFEIARKAFERCLELDPSRPVIRQYYGSLLRDLGSLRESETELRRAVADAAPDDYLTQINLAETLTALGKTEEAEAILKGILAKEPRHTKARAALGRLLSVEGRFREAIPELEVGAAAQPKNPEPWIEIGEAYLALGEAGGAREAADRALERSPGHPWALSVSGHALALQGRKAEALAILKQALAAGPRRPEVWRSLGASFAAAGDARDAALCLRNAGPAAREAGGAARPHDAPPGGHNP